MVTGWLVSGYCYLSSAGNQSCSVRRHSAASDDPPLVQVVGGLWFFSRTLWVRTLLLLGYSKCLGIQHSNKCEILSGHQLDVSSVFTHEGSCHRLWLTQGSGFDTDASPGELSLPQGRSTLRIHLTMSPEA